MRFARYILLILLISAVGARAGIIGFAFDGACFRKDASNVVWEFSYSFADTLIDYRLVDGKYCGALKIYLEIESASGTVIDHSWESKHCSEVPVRGFKDNLVGLKRFILPFGQYKGKLRVVDINDPESQLSREFDIFAKKFSSSDIGISDIQMAQYIEYKSERTMNWHRMFSKGSIYVVPNASLEYFGTKPELNAYVELYNLKTYAPGGYTIYHKIIDGVDRELLSVPREKKSIGDGIVELVQLSLDVLSTGNYYLEVLAVYETGGIKDSVFARKKFYYINPDMLPDMATNFVESNTYEKSEFSTLSYSEVESEFKKALPLATKFEKNQFERLGTLPAKRRFLFRFWKGRDPDPETAQNERLMEFRKALNYVNTYFSFGSDDNGWSTDRGRILLKYGFPTDRERNPSVGNQRAYEVWYYDEVQGGIRFYFVDLFGFNEYRLVHSTALSEIFNPNWEQDYLQSTKDYEQMLDDD